MAHHRAAAFACLVLALLASQAAAGAVNSSPLLVEKLTPSSHTAAKLASGYYETSKSELCTSTIKNCAAFGCADGECSVTYPDVAFETDFSCCGHKGYGGGYDVDSSFTVGGVTAKVGSCVWTLNTYTTGEPTVNTSPLTVRLGDIKAVCTLNHDAESCGVPGCERMVLTLQGHAYGSQVYSKTNIPGYTLDLSNGEVCCDLIDTTNVLNWNAVCDTGRRMEKTAAKGLHKKQQTAGSTGRRLSEQPAELQYDHHYHHDEGYYNERTTGFQGNATIFSGTMYITRVHPSGSEKIEETGLFEFAYSAELDPITAGTAAAYSSFHEIEPQTLKLVFTKEEESKEYYSGSKATRR